MDNYMVIFSIQLDKYIVKTNGKLISANKKNYVNYEEQVHSKLTVISSSILSNLMEHTSKYELI